MFRNLINQLEDSFFVGHYGAMKKLILILFLIGCASTQQNYKKDHQNFLNKVQRQKSLLPEKEYQNFLKKEIQRKQGELSALRGIQGGEEKQLDHHEVMSNSNQNVNDVHNFQARSSQHRLKNLNDRIQMVQKEIFFLQSQIK